VALHDRDVLRIGSSLLTFCAPAEEAGPRTVVGEVLVDPGALTQAQRAVLVALCRPLQQGQHYATPATNLEIARELFLSVDGVKAHLRALYHRLGIDDLAQNQKRLRLAEMALRHGLVSTHEL
jgi:DNA-binding NarL/FixJ family response regulator